LTRQGRQTCFATWQTLPSRCPLADCDRRALRSQQFVEATRADIAAREAKSRDAVEAYWAAHPTQRVPRERIDGFLARLASDALRRDQNKCGT